MQQSTCSKCGTANERTTYVKCPICHKHVCEPCSYNRGGRLFCSLYCADEFFFGDEE